MLYQLDYNLLKLLLLIPDEKKLGCPTNTIFELVDFFLTGLVGRNIKNTYRSCQEKIY